MGLINLADTKPYAEFDSSDATKHYPRCYDIGHSSSVVIVDFVHRSGVRPYSLTCRGFPHDVAAAVHKQLIGSTDEI